MVFEETDIVIQMFIFRVVLDACNGSFVILFVILKKMFPTKNNHM